ncbi:DUF342 domain-containing protein [Photobacterium ganghwense]|uniref:Flagellar Assembly Protein A N-terminal region domain-containing protein n=1 Tax=Photobacterium ganghwense TaxID=320778 RepID=A0A0J1K6A6_9GAMM|nr:FapA family protein [Photobacterium ganghwense]KLV09892.1 hypothetical protein ABT57_09455 [Photobacterium ganghwense]PSU09261.1 DUF342 domain-containing protein [Photobacterium ganghwense]
MAERFLRFSDDGQAVLFIPKAAGRQEQELTRADILAQLAELGAERFYLFEQAVDSALARVKTAQAAESADRSSGHPAPTSPKDAIIVAERRDAQLVVKTDPDGMRASLTVTAPYGGTHLSGPGLLDVLQSHHIVKGIRKSQLQHLLSQTLALNPGEKISLPVAFGKLPEHGKNTRFEPLVEDAGSRVLRPQQTDDGKVDMRDLGELITVKSGQPLMRRYPATEGTHGYTVHGKVLPAKPGKSEEFEAGEGTLISQADPDILLANKAGIPVRQKRGMQIDDALTLAGVNVATGHISFDGSVIISGDVTPGMKVTASGNIVVGGFVELAELTAGGDVVIQKGIIGRKQEGMDYACRIIAGGSVTSKFAQFAGIETGMDMVCTLHVLHCRIRAAGEVVVMDQLKRHGTLSGGDVEAGYNVKVVNLGALAGVPTTVKAFTKSPTLLQHIQAVQREIDAELGQIDKIRQAQHKLLSIPQANRPPELVDKIRTISLQHQSLMTSLREQQQQLRDEYDEVRRLVAVKVLNRVYPGVKVQLERDLISVSNEHGPSKIHFDDQELVLQPL